MGVDNVLYTALSRKVSFRIITYSQILVYLSLSEEISASLDPRAISHD